MSESELVEAAATGAAAAVAAVQDDQAEEQRQVATEIAADTAADASVLAVEAATDAVAQAEVATEVAEASGAVAVEAAVQAEAATEVALTVEDEVRQLREENRSAFAQLRDLLTKPAEPEESEPTKVVVTNEPASSGDGPGSSEHTDPNERAKRKRFGGR